MSDWSCPLPAAGDPCIQLAQGGGGRATARLLEDIFFPAFDNALLAERHDGAVFETAGRLAFTTDGHVVAPLFFPGGDIGSLAVNGTVNDLAMCGARPLHLSAAFILEEGLAVETLRRIVASMAVAARLAGVAIVTGDLKVVERGKADKMFIATSGIGQVLSPTPIRPQAVRPGDCLILSGDLGRHGIAVLAAREQLGFKSPVASDCAPLAEPVLALIEEGARVRCLRDLTRGGLASAAVEIAETSGLCLAFEEEAIPVAREVASASEILGFDPLHLANEGRFLAVVAPEDADKALAILRRHTVSRDACLAGRVGSTPKARVTLKTKIGGTRLIDMPSGEQLPRIC